MKEEDQRLSIYIPVDALATNYLPKRDLAERLLYFLEIGKDREILLLTILSTENILEIEDHLEKANISTSGPPMSRKQNTSDASGSDFELELETSAQPGRTIEQEYLNPSQEDSNMTPSSRKKSPLRNADGRRLESRQRQTSKGARPTMLAPLIDKRLSDILAAAASFDMRDADVISGFSSRSALEKGTHPLVSNTKKCYAVRCC